MRWGLWCLREATRQDSVAGPACRGLWLRRALAVAAYPARILGLHVTRYRITFLKLPVSVGRRAPER
jgi:hypothetical protein